MPWDGTPVRWGLSLRLSASFAAMAAFVLFAVVASLVFFMVFRDATARLIDEHLPGFSILTEVARHSETVVAGVPVLIAAADEPARRRAAEELAGETTAIANLVEGWRALPGRLDLGPLREEVAGLADLLARLDHVVGERLAITARQAFLAERSQEILRRFQDYLAPWLSATENAMVELAEHPIDGESSEIREARWRALGAIQRSILIGQREIERLGTLLIAMTTTAVGEHRGLALESRFEHTLWLVGRSIDELPGGDPQVPQRLLQEAAELGRGEAGAFALWRKDRQRERVLAEAVEESRSRSARLSACITTLVGALRNDAQHTVAKVDETRRGATASLLVISFLAVVSSFCLARFYIGCNVVQRIKGLVRSVIGIASGNLQVPIDVHGNDEISLMANALTVFRDTARQVDTAHRLAARESRRLADAVGIMAEGFLLVDGDGSVVLASPRFRALLPDVAVEPGRRLADAAREAGLPAILAPLVASTAEEALRSGLQVDLALPDARWLRLTARRTDEGGLVALWADISEAKRHEAEITAKTVLLETTLQTISEGISVFDANLKLVAWNQAFFDLYDFPERFARVGTPFETLILHNARCGEYGPGDPLEQTRERVERAQRMRPHQLERVRPSGACLDIRERPMPGGGFVTTYTDITRHRVAESNLRHLAETDALTGIANRAAFLRAANDRLRAWLGEGLSSALLFLDLDGFKDVNDTFGHPVGDRVLVEIAGRLIDELGMGELGGHLVGRFGGDEFVVLLEAPTGREAAKALAQRIIDAVSQPIRVGSRDVQLGVSVGIACFPQDGEDPGSLLRRADIAMYQGKSQGKATQRNLPTFFTRGMEARSRRRRQLLNDLRQALPRGELELHYQPQISFASGRPVGVEALMRWHHPADGSVSPSVFIPIAEESGLIAEMGEWALTTVAEDARRWTRMGLPPLEIAVNLSAVQFAAAAQLKAQIGRILGSGAAGGNRFVLEITESTLMKNLDSALATMNELVEAGIQFAIDDFGTGYSSLSYLKQIPVQQLKIDRSFIVDLDSNADAAAIIETVVAMAGRLKLATVAEGVETACQFAFLRALGCNVAQGYYCARPMPAQRFESWMMGDGVEPDLGQERAPSCVGAELQWSGRPT